MHTEVASMEYTEEDQNFLLSSYSILAPTSPPTFSLLVFLLYILQYVEQVQHGPNNYKDTKP